jgi:hypothetical protein
LELKKCGKRNLFEIKKEKKLFVAQGLKGSEQVPYFHVCNFLKLNIEHKIWDKKLLLLSII